MARVLFVCLGNICRSPTAEAVMRALADEAGLDLEIDSAGTGSWHVGSPPDHRASAAASRRGIVMTGSARQVRASDFEDFDLIVAMDRSNLADLKRIASSEADRRKLRLLRDFEPDQTGDLDVPDPYYGGAGGFDEVLDIAERCCTALIAELGPADPPSPSGS